MNEELNDVIYQQIVDLSKQGDESLDNNNFDDAIQRYEEAISLIPEPIEDWEASTWLLTALGEAYFFKQDYQNALKSLQSAMHCPDAIGNPLIHLRLGQTQLELGNEVKAKDELVRAYMGGGEEIFEDEDSKYFDLVKESIQIEE